MSSKRFFSKFHEVCLKPNFWLFRIFYGFLFLLMAYGLPLTAYAQKLAFLVPEKNPNSQIVIEKLEANLLANFKILDDSLAEAVMLSSTRRNVFNLSTEEAQNLGKAIGCDFFVVQKSETLRRESLSRPAYYESYSVIYLVSSRTGHLVFWKLLNAEADNSAEAEKRLFASIENLAPEISASIKSSDEKELSGIQSPELTEMPAESSPESKNFRSPLPYRRLKPEYTNLANLYNVAATVDATVDLDETGKVSRVEITRWAGYGLDESVTETIKKMQWRAAERDGKALPIRVLLRYNFKKLKSEDDEQ